MAEVSAATGSLSQSLGYRSKVKTGVWVYKTVRLSCAACMQNRVNSWVV